MKAAQPTMATCELLIRCVGRPMRISLFDSVFPDRIGRYPGILVQLLGDSLVVECLDVPPSMPPTTNVTLELMNEHERFWCHTRLQAGVDFLPNRLRLEWPETIQTVQKRLSPRVDTYMPVHYCTSDSHVPSRGIIRDISRGGASLETSMPLSPGLDVSLVFELGSGLCFQDIRAQVLRVSGTRTGGWLSGLKFLSLSDEQESDLERWVQSRCSH